MESRSPGVLKPIPRPKTMDSKAESATSQSTTQKPVDIIFVHGLGGNACETWTHKDTGSFWPEWLYDEQGFENVRCFTFEYSVDFATFLGAENVSGIAGFARQLLGELRGRIADKDSVILFASV